MIHPHSFTKEWIDAVSSTLQFNDKNLIEKVVRAMSLLEMLKESGCPFVFKGGTALMLALADSTHRLSIDIDIICPPRTEIEDYLSKYASHGFTEFELVERQQRGTDIPKSHSKLFYQIAYKPDATTSSFILLDVLYEEDYYTKLQTVPIESPFVKLEGTPLTVSVPSIEDLIGDKMTAFAPNTTGIPYIKSGKSTSMEIIKQLYDIGRLFERFTNLEVASNTFKKVALIELSYRSLQENLAVVYEDIRQTALCISTRGVEGTGDFKALQDGIPRIKSFMFQDRYTIEDAIVDASRAAYLATLIEKESNTIERYSGDPLEVSQMTIQSSLTNKLNKLKKTSPEAFYYWSRASELLL